MWVGGEEGNETSGKDIDVMKQKTSHSFAERGILNSSKRAGPLRQECRNSGRLNFVLRRLMFVGVPGWHCSGHLWFSGASQDFWEVFCTPKMRFLVHPYAKPPDLHWLMSGAIVGQDIGCPARLPWCSPVPPAYCRVSTINYVTIAFFFARPFHSLFVTSNISTSHRP